MTDYTLDVDSMSITVTLQNVALESDCVLSVGALSVAQSLTGIALESDCVLSVGSLPISETYTDWRYTHESFYWMTGAMARWTPRSNYRMQGVIVDYMTTTPNTRSTFSTNYIKPGDVDTDAKFNL